MNQRGRIFSITQYRFIAKWMFSRRKYSLRGSILISMVGSQFQNQMNFYRQSGPFAIVVKWGEWDVGVDINAKGGDYVGIGLSLMSTSMGVLLTFSHWCQLVFQVTSKEDECHSKEWPLDSSVYKSVFDLCARDVKLITMLCGCRTTGLPPDEDVVTMWRND